MLSRHSGVVVVGVGVGEKNFLASKPRSWPSIIPRKEMREHSSHFHLQPLGLYWWEVRFARRQTPPQIMLWLFLPDENPHPPPWSHILGRKVHKGSQPSVRELDALHSLWNYLLPDSLWRWFPGLVCTVVYHHVAALKLHFTWPCSSRLGMINSHDFMVTLTRFKSILVLPLTSKRDFVCHLDFLSPSVPTCKMNIRMPVC